MTNTKRGDLDPLQACTAVAAIALFALAGCDLFGPSRPTRVYTPDIIGPIDDIRAVPGTRLAHEAVVGEKVVRYTKDWPRDLGFTGSTGSLLIYGSEGDDSWFFSVAHRDTGDLAGCFVLPAGRVYEAGTDLIFSVSPDEAIRLPKGDALTLPSPDAETGMYPSLPGHSYCLDDDGTVVGSQIPGSGLP